MHPHIQELISQGENQQLDFKYCISDTRKIARSLVAFSNTDGGILLVGVKDNGTVAGIRDDEEYYMIETAAYIFCRPEIKFESQTWNIEGKTILEIIVPKGDKKPSLAKEENGKWRAYIRVNDQNLLANRVLIKTWERQKRPKGTFIKYSRLEKILLDYMKKHEEISLEKFCTIAHISKYTAENIFINLLSVEVISIRFTEKDIFYSLC